MDIILLTDCMQQPSTQIKAHVKGKTGNFTFDTVLIKGLRENRFVTVTVENGEVTEKSYVTIPKDALAKANEAARLHAQSSNMTRNEQKTLI